MMTPHAFHDLPERAFPFLICIIDAETHELRWSAWVDGPGGVRIPGKDLVNDGQPCEVAVRLADGVIVEG